MLSFLRIIIFGIAFDQCKWSFVALSDGREGDTCEFSLEGNASKILLLILLSDRKLIIDYVEASQVSIIHTYTLLELIIPFLEGFC